MTKFITLTDADGDNVALPVNDIVLVAKHVADPNAPIILGKTAKSLVIARTGLRIEVKETVLEVAALVNG